MELSHRVPRGQVICWCIFEFLRSLAKTQMELPLCWLSFVVWYRTCQLLSSCLMALFRLVICFFNNWLIKIMSLLIDRIDRLYSINFEQHLSKTQCPIIYLLIVLLLPTITPPIENFEEYIYFLPPLHFKFAPFFSTLFFVYMACIIGEWAISPILKSIIYPIRLNNHIVSALQHARQLQKKRVLQKN